MLLRQAFACLLLGAAAAQQGIRATYGPTVNPAAFALSNATTTTAPTLSFAWSAGSRPYPGPFSALWVGTLTPPPSSQPTWFAAQFGASSGAFFKLWLDDHLLVNAQASGLNHTAVGLYPLLLRPSGSLLRVEYGAIGDAASAALLMGPSAAGPWALLPPSALTPAPPNPAEDTYQQRRSLEEAGWGTWDASDMLSSVLLPSGLAFALSFTDAASGGATTAQVRMACQGLRPGLHSARGNYSDIEVLELVGGAASIRLQSATTPQGDLALLLTTLPGSPRPADVTVHIAARNMLPFSACAASATAAALTMACAGAPAVTLRPAPPTAAAASSSPNALSFPLPPAGASAAWSTAPGASPMTLPQAGALVAARRAELLALFAPHGAALNDTAAGLYTAVAWSTIYSHTQGLVNGEFGRSEQLFEWDTLLAGALAMGVDEWCALNNIIRIAKSAVPAGFAPGYMLHEVGEVDNSKPPVAGLALLEVHGLYQQAWAVALVLDALIAFNQWWVAGRMVQGIIAPGSLLDPALAPIERAGHGSAQAGKFETGLDNSPLYDNATFDSTTGLLSVWDVGLQALYIADARALCALGRSVGRGEVCSDLLARAAAGAARLEEALWCAEAGSYLNRDYVTGQWVRATGPPMLYPLLMGGSSLAVLEGLLQRYFFNASEWCGDADVCQYGLPSISRASPAFQAQDYWRGRVWGPMNYLAYLALREYAPVSALAQRALRSLALQSQAVFLKEWLLKHHVMENYSALDGTGCESSGRASPFYHWGALTAKVALEVLGGGARSQG